MFEDSIYKIEHEMILKESVFRCATEIDKAERVAFITGINLTCERIVQAMRKEKKDHFDALVSACEWVKEEETQSECNGCGNCSSCKEKDTESQN